MADEERPTSNDGKAPLLPLRAFYFFNFAALGVLFPFLPLLLDSRSLSPAQISWIIVVIPAFNLLVPPFWGNLADALRARLPLLRLACLGSGVTVLLLIPDFGFWGAIVAMAVFSVFRAPLTALGDAAAYDALGGRSAGYASIRVWGSVGFTLFVLAPGLAVGAHQTTIVVLITSVVFFLAAASVLSLRAPPLGREPRVFSQTLHILRRPRVFLFLGASTVYYSAHAAYDSCFSLHLRRLGEADAFVGTAWAVGVAAEIALMLLATRKFLGNRDSGAMLTLCAAVAALRWALLSWVTSQTALLAVQTLHAVTFGLWYLSLVKFAQEQAPPHLRTSLQSFASAFMGLGMVIGILAGGQVLEHSDGFLLFRFGAATAGAALVLYGLSYFFQQRARRRAAAIDAGPVEPG